MAENVKTFVGYFLHCATTDSAKIIARPYGHTMHSTKPNELNNFDFCYMTKDENGLTFVLILKDDLSGYVWLFPYNTPDTASAEDGLEKLFSDF